MIPSLCVTHSVIRAEPLGTLVNDVLAKSGIPHTLYYIAGYWESIEWYDMLKVAEDGSITLGLFMPDKLTQHFTTVRRVGSFVQQIFDDPDKFLGEKSSVSLSSLCSLEKPGTHTDWIQAKKC